jgi:hypothetical protein
MDYVLLAPFGFALTVATLLFANFGRFAGIAVGREVRARCAEPPSR